MEARKHGCPVQEVKFPVEECSSAAVHWWADTVMTVETSRGGTCHEIKSCDYMMGLGSLWGLIDFTLVAPPVTYHVSSVCRVETWNNLRRLLLLSCGLGTTTEPMYRLCGCKQVFLGDYCWHPVIWWQASDHSVIIGPMATHRSSAVPEQWLKEWGQGKEHNLQQLEICNFVLARKCLFTTQAWPRSFNMLRLLISFLVKVSSSLVH